MTDHPDDWRRPQHSSTVFLAARKLYPRLGLRHDHYTPPAWSINLLGVDDINNAYLHGTPAELHNLALALLAVADQAAAAEALAAETPPTIDVSADGGATWRPLGQQAEDENVEAFLEDRAIDAAEADDRWTTGDPSPIDLL